MMSDLLTSWVRTIVPALWSALIAWLISLGLPEAITNALAGIGEQVLVPIVLAGVYALLRWLEPKLPPWLAKLFFGSSRPPTYAKL